MKKNCLEMFKNDNKKLGFICEWKKTKNLDRVTIKQFQIIKYIN